MKRFTFFSLIIFILLFQGAFAENDLVFETAQSEYYFNVGEDAFIPITVLNSYGVEIEGYLTFESVSEINQGGFSYSSRNSDTQYFVSSIENREISIGIGTAQAPSDVTLDVSYDYINPDKESILLTLPQITVHFVSDESQKQNQENKQSSSSEKNSNSNQNQQQQQQQNQQNQQQQQQAQQNQAQSQKERLEEEKRRQELQNQLQNKLQNNQLNQNTEQLQREIDEQQKTRDEFSQNLRQNEEFQKKHEELLNEGYKPTDENIQAQDQQNGEFQNTYENEQGDKATLDGKVENGELTSLETHFQKGEKQLLDDLYQDERFQEFNQELLNEGFYAQNPVINHVDNSTTIEIIYENDQNETATITAEINDDLIEDVKLSRNRKIIPYLFLFSGIVLTLIGVYLLKKYGGKDDTIPRILYKNVGYKERSRQILRESKHLFHDKRYKDAYGKAAEAVRFYYSHKLDLKKELTNSELVKNLRHNNMTFSDVQECLNLCGLVEFAKYTANKKDFDKIISIAQKLIK